MSAASSSSEAFQFEKQLVEELKPIEAGGAPLMLLLRGNEDAVISTVRGSGKLKLSVTTSDGFTICQGATMYDSMGKFWVNENEEVDLNHSLRGDSSLVHSIWCERQQGAEEESTLHVTIRHVFRFGHDQQLNN
jgi:hypothetical protein